MIQFQKVVADEARNLLVVYETGSFNQPIAILDEYDVQRLIAETETENTKLSEKLSHIKKIVEEHIVRGAVTSNEAIVALSNYLEIEIS